MKKLFILAFGALLFASCTEEGDTINNTTSSSGTDALVSDDGKTLFKIFASGTENSAYFTSQTFKPTSTTLENLGGGSSAIFTSDIPSAFVTGIDLSSASALKTIQSNAFSSYTALTSVNLGSSITSIASSNAFGTMGTELPTLSIPATLADADIVNVPRPVVDLTITRGTTTGATGAALPALGVVGTDRLTTLTLDVGTPTTAVAQIPSSFVPSTATALSTLTFDGTYLVELSSTPVAAATNSFPGNGAVLIDANLSSVTALKIEFKTLSALQSFIMGGMEGSTTDIYAAVTDTDFTTTGLLPFATATAPTATANYLSTISNGTVDLTFKVPSTVNIAATTTAGNHTIKEALEEIGATYASTVANITLQQ